MNEIIVNLEGKEYQIDVQQAKKLGILKEKDQKCKSWEEFHNKYRDKKGFFYDMDIARVDIINNPIMTAEQLTENEAIAIKAFSRLLKLRRDWIGDWNPDWTRNIEKYCIVCENNLVDIMQGAYITHPFSFPTKKMAKEFLKYFKDLFEQCKDII